MAFVSGKSSWPSDSRSFEEGRPVEDRTEGRACVCPIACTCCGSARALSARADSDVQLLCLVASGLHRVHPQPTKGEKGKLLRWGRFQFSTQRKKSATVVMSLSALSSKLMESPAKKALLAGQKPLWGARRGPSYFFVLNLQHPPVPAPVPVECVSYLSSVI